MPTMSGFDTGWPATKVPFSLVGEPALSDCSPAIEIAMLQAPEEISNRVVVTVILEDQVAAALGAVVISGIVIV